MPKRSTKPEPLVVPSVTDEDPMTSRRITKQPKKTNRAAAAIKKIARKARRRR